MCVWDGWPQREEAEREGDFVLPEDDGWRGDTHLEEWPELLAGPEYHLFKRDGHVPPEA